MELKLKCITFKLHITLSGFSGSTHATLKMCLISSAKPMRAPLLAEIYKRGMPNSRDLSDAF